MHGTLLEQSQGLVERAFTFHGASCQSSIIFLVTSGACFIAALGEVFEVKDLKPIARRASWVGFATLITGLIAIVFDLGRPDRFYYALMGHMNLRSPMLWMILFYVAEAIAIALELLVSMRRDFAYIANRSVGLRRLFYRILALGATDESAEARARDERLAKSLNFIALLLLLAAYSNLGCIFVAAEARGWRIASLTPIEMTIVGLTMGAAIVALVEILVSWARNEVVSGEKASALLKLRKILLMLLFTYMFFEAWQHIARAWYRSPEAYMLEYVYTRGPLAFDFWVFQITLGFIVPVVMLAIPRIGKTTAGLATASTLVLAGIFAQRYLMVIGAQLPPLITGFPWGYYAPTSYECLFTAGMLALAALLITVGELILPIDKKLFLNET